MASSWLWLNLVLNLALTLTLIPTALICLEFLAREQVSCSPGMGNPGRCGCPGDRSVSVLEGLRSRQLAKAGCGPVSIMSPGALRCVHIPRAAPFARVDRTGFACAVSLIAPRSILFGPRVMGMGV